jgi:hypothetical protein
MGKHRNCNRHRNEGPKTISSFQKPVNLPDAELDAIRKEQQLQHQATQINFERNRRHPPHTQIVALLENGASFNGKAVMFNNPRMPKCKVFFKDKNRHELSIDMDIDLKNPSPEKIAVVQSNINSYLLALHTEAALEFPAWLEKYSARVNESNPFFNLDEIREEFKFKKSRFVLWRTAADIGFFDDMWPQYARFNKIVHLEIREPEPVS